MKDKTFYVVNLFKDNICSCLFKIEFDFIDKNIKLKINNIFNKKICLLNNYDVWETLRLLSILIKTFYIYFNNYENNKLEDIDFELRKLLNSDLGNNNKVCLNSEFELLFLDNDIKLYSIKEKDYYVFKHEDIINLIKFCEEIKIYILSSELKTCKYS